jgi:hypothetical protein
LRLRIKHALRRVHIDRRHHDHLHLTLRIMWAYRGIYHWHSHILTLQPPVHDLLLVLCGCHPYNSPNRLLQGCCSVTHPRYLIQLRKLLLCIINRASCFLRFLDYIPSSSSNKFIHKPIIVNFAPLERGHFLQLPLIYTRLISIDIFPITFGLGGLG